MNSFRLQPRLGYLVKTFPKVSETFILRELVALERQGLEPHIFALQRPQERQVQPLAAQLRAQVTYLPTPEENKRHLLRMHLQLLQRQPWRYGQAMCWLLSRPQGLSLRHFWQAGALAWQLVRAGLTHLHVHYLSMPAHVAVLTHLLCGVSYSLAAHAKDIYLATPTDLHRKMRWARFVVTCTEANRRFLQEVAPQGVPIHRVYHGLEVHAFQAPAHGAAVPCPTVLSVGRLREKKGFPCLLRACRVLKDQGYRLQCRIVGYGPQQEELERLIAMLDLSDTVHLLGKCTHEALLRLYREATVFVLPCQIAADGDRDGIPNVLLEAMAMQLPVVSTWVSGIPELVTHGRQGFLVPPQDPHALAGALALLLERPHLRQQFGRAGRQKVCQQFALQTNTAQIKGLLLQALGASHRRGTGRGSSEALDILLPEAVGNSELGGKDKGA